VLYRPLSLAYSVPQQLEVFYPVSDAQALNPGIRTPIVLAPMAGASGGALAGEVSLAGGFGFLAPGEGVALTNSGRI
jgi:hypothetical protein